MNRKFDDIGLLEYEAYYQYPGDYKTRKVLGRAIAKGARGEEVMQLVAKAKKEQLVKQESDRLAARITDELSPLLPEVETRSLLEVAQEAAEPSTDSRWELLQAQRAVLAEIREARS